MQRRIQREVDDANDEVKIQREDELEEKRKRERRKSRFFSFEGLDENSGPSGAATPGHNRKKISVPKNIAEVAISHLHEWKSPGSSGESGSSSETSEAGTKERGPK